METKDFAKAHARAVLDKPNTEATLDDIPYFIDEFRNDNPGACKAIVIIEKDHGGVAIFSTKACLSEMVYMLEIAKLSLILDS